MNGLVHLLQYQDDSNDFEEENKNDFWTKWFEIRPWHKPVFTNLGLKQVIVGVLNWIYQNLFFEFKKNNKKI